MSLPDSEIIVHYRQDGSGTTYTFTDYLSKVNSEWAKQVAAGMLVRWPTGLHEDGNEGVADAVKNQAGAIGYVELSYAVSKNIPYALLQNRSGAWVEPTEQTMAAAANSQVDQMPIDLQQSITDPPGALAYPISSYSYLLFFRQQADQAKVGSFRKFVSWVLHEGQRYTAQLHYAPLPEKVAERADAQLRQINVGTVSAASACKARLGLAKHSTTPVLIRDDDDAGYLGSD